MTLTATSPSQVGRHRNWALLAACAVLVVAVAGVFLSGHHHKAFNWQQLPTPGQDLSSAGSAIGAGGGQGDGVVRVVEPGQTGQFSVNVTCRGDGLLTIKISGTQWGQVQCFGKQAVDYRLTKASTSASDVHITTNSGVAWKVIAAVGS